MATLTRWRYGITIKDMKSKLLANITPEEILDKEFLQPMRITQYRLARDIGVPPRRINEIVKGQRAITAGTALRLGRYFGVAPEFWLNLQTHYDLEHEQERLAGRLEKEVKVLAAAYVDDPCFAHEHRHPV
jgi:antitoxin HigA-1